MEGHIIETRYPLTFREEEAGRLGALLSNRRSVVLVGMKRVGISNFLRFFLYHKDIPQTYLKGDNHFFVPVDLNDLVERELYPFWVLTLKRIVDSVDALPAAAALKKRIESLFLDSIQSQDLFFTIDSVRKSILLLIEQDIEPTFFLLRFDRIEKAVNQQFLANLEGLADGAHKRLTYVVTSYRTLDELSPEVISKTWQSALFSTQYIKPAKKEDVETIFETYKKKYTLHLSSPVLRELFGLVDGYTQFLQFALILLHERKIPLKTAADVFLLLSKDERIMLQCEELWESITKEEQQVLLQLVKKRKIGQKQKEQAKYLWDTGFVKEETIFSPLFVSYLTQKG